MLTTFDKMIARSHGISFGFFENLQLDYLLRVFESMTPDAQQEQFEMQKLF